MHAQQAWRWEPIASPSLNRTVAAHATKVQYNVIKARKVLGMTGLLLVAVHALMSYMLFSPAVYAQFFEPDGTLTLMGGLSRLGGVLASSPCGPTP